MELQALDTYALKAATDVQFYLALKKTHLNTDWNFDH